MSSLASLHLCQCQLGRASCPVETMAAWFPPIPVPRATVAASRQSRQPWRWLESLKPQQASIPSTTSPSLGRYLRSTREKESKNSGSSSTSSSKHKQQQAQAWRLSQSQTHPTHSLAGYIALPPPSTGRNGMVAARLLREDLCFSPNLSVGIPEKGMGNYAR